LKDADADVVLVDRNDYHTFQPLLYQVATDLLELAAVGHPLRDLFHDQPNAAVHQATVTRIDPENREVQFEELTPISYDTLVVAYYRGIPQDAARLTLVEAGPVLFSMFKPDIRAYTQKALAKRGVEVLLGEIVASVEPTRVRLRSGTSIRAHTLVWGAGLQGSAVLRSLGVELQKGGRIGVGPDLRGPGHPEIFAVG